MVKTTGAEFKAFYSDKGFWPHDTEGYHEDETVTINGEPVAESYDLASVADTAMMTLDGGAVYSKKWENDAAPAFDTYFKRWRKLQTTAIIMVECKKDDLRNITAIIKVAGGKVIS